MRYVLYALFQKPGTAETALQELSQADLPPDSYHLFIHKQNLTQDLRASESDGRPGLLIGLLAGAAGGALLGWLGAGPLALWSLPLSAAIGFGLFVGTICGLLGGGIYSTGLVNRNLQGLVASFRPGQTLITAELDSPQSRHTVEQIFRKYGALEASA